MKTIKIKLGNNKAVKYAEEIGSCFGFFYTKENKFCLSNYVENFEYDTLDGLLLAWESTLILNDYDNSTNCWREIIDYIECEVKPRLCKEQRKDYYNR